MITASQANLLFSILTVIGQAIIIATLFVIVVSWKRKKSHKMLVFLDKHGILFAFVVALVAMTGSLTYSEIIGYEPCKLCWFQRILMYPQVALFGLALLKKDRSIRDYSILLSSLGVLIATYHYALQMGVAPVTSCSAVGSSVSCSQIFTMQFGYITIPMMSLTAFSMILLFMLGLRLHDNLKKSSK
ncbi:MAG: disulfide bond formation protein B [Candidatus Aenigmarchaeota archaeon]|nr:disulfide bond formation protein B [Candidatus Aenigmarchaeota archaeon]